MTETKGFSFRLNQKDPVEKELSDMLAKKPTTYVIIEALKLYKRFDEAREQAIQDAIDSLVRTRRTAAAAPVRQDNDDLEDFDL